jgi:hypothetical protein
MRYKWGIPGPWLIFLAKNSLTERLCVRHIVMVHDPRVREQLWPHTMNPMSWMFQRGETSGRQSAIIPHQCFNHIHHSKTYAFLHTFAYTFQRFWLVFSKFE